MSKILKASNVKMDFNNKVNIDLPVFSNNYVNAKITNIEDDSFENDGYEGEDFREINFQAQDFNNVESEEEKENIYEDIIEKAKLEAEEILQKAREEASDIINEERARFENEKAEVLNECRKKGFDEGYQDSLQKVDSMLAEAKQTLDNAVEEREKILDDIEPEIINLVINIIEKFLGKSLKLNPQLIIALIKQGLSQTTVKGEISVHVSENDYLSVNNKKDEILSFTDGSTDIEIVKDFSLNTGDCIIVTPFGNIDCSLNQQFEGLKNDLYYILENR